MKRHMRLECIVFLLCACHPLFPAAQVTLLPTSVFLADDFGVGSMDIINTTDHRQEVGIQFEFAYPDGDGEGHLMMTGDDQEMASRFGMDEQIRAFPRSFLLSPGGRQTVRLQVRPMRDRPDGVYWTRAVVTSRAAVEDIGRERVSEGLGTRIQYVFKQNIPVYYRKGKVNTGLEILDVKTGLKSDRLVVKSRLRPVGNAPYNGSVDAVLRNSSGQVITRQHTSVVVCSESLRRLEIPFPDVILDRGNYFLEMVYRTRRRDIPSSDLVQAPPVTYTVRIATE